MSEENVLVLFFFLSFSPSCAQGGGKGDVLLAVKLHQRGKNGDNHLMSP